MNPFKRVLLFLLALIPANFYAMEAGWYYAPVQVKFTPQDDMKDTIFSLLNNAKNQIVIAMYWLTDPSIVNLLTALKQKGIDIQIIFDENPHRYVNINSIINPLLRSGIVPLVFPSEHTRNFMATCDKILMHHKFLVIDEEIVFTGSANFTKKACEDQSNYENTVIIRSREVAQQYLKAFDTIEKYILDSYVKIVKTKELIADWLMQLLPFIFSTKAILQKMIYARWHTFNSIEQGRIVKAFNIELITPEQKTFLRNRNIVPEGMTKQHATELINSIIKEEEQYAF